MAGRPNPRPRGELENEIVAALAAATEPVTPAQVQAELGEELAYTTVQTTLTRLYAKGAVTRTPHGRAYAYELIGDQTDAQAGLTARQMQKLLDAGVDRASVLSRFVDTLDDSSEQLLRELLEEHSAPSRKGRSASRRRSP